MLVTRWAARAAAVCAIGFMMMVGSANADTTAYDDPVGDSTSVDISRVRVAHANAVKISVRSAVSLDAGQVYSFWVDTGRGPRPTFYVSFRANSDSGSGLTVVQYFGQRPIRTVECPGIRGHADMFDGKPVSVRIPRACLGDPKRVRVAVKFLDETTGAVDWALERRTFGPWVAQ